MEDKKIEIEHPHINPDDIKWDICCSKSSKAFIKYVVTVIMSIIILTFSIFMIATNPEKDNSIYFSLVSSILSLYVPAPTLDNLNEKL